MSEKDSTPDYPLLDNTPVRQHLTALRMFRSLIPLSDERFGLKTEDDLETNRQEAKRLLLWPPNLFAFTSELLRSTGIYYLVVSPAKSDIDSLKELWPPDEIQGWSDKVRKWGQEWRQKLVAIEDREFFSKRVYQNPDLDAKELDRLLEKLLPQALLDQWNNLAAGFDWSDIKDLRCLNEEPEERARHWKAFVNLMTLHAVADEACLGWGIREYVPEWGESKKSVAQSFAEELLQNFGTLATIHSNRCRVLPKRHTPNVGMTLRSISSNLAFFHRSSIDVRWRRSADSPLIQCTKDEATPGEEPKISSLNVLLLPWPEQIRSTDFSTIKLKDSPFKANPKREGFFEYRPAQPQEEDKFIKDLPDLLESAKEEATRIDLVILPELAISDKHLEKFERALTDKEVSGYIAGVRQERDGKHNRFARNMVYCKFSEKIRGTKYIFPDDTPGKEDREEYRQHKHHRWKLDRQQIIKYQLGGKLSTNRNWWEGIKLGRRKVTFVNVGNEITICPLICEDLARQEPISDLIRAVGPTFVVAILMDGPQKWSRWSAAYASVLADDPGSSVLTFTCKGMVNRARTPGVEKSRAIALWKDPLSLPVEIELEDDKTRGIVLYLNVEEQREITADGREEAVATPYLTLGGIRYVSGK